MIRNTNKKESRKIAKSLNIDVKMNLNFLSFTQDRDTKISLLEVKKASQSIVQRMSKNPDQAHSLRWVRNTDRNKRILAGYLMRRVVKRRLVKLGMNYMPCCNTFSEQKPKAEHDHKQVTNDCLLLLLGEEVKTQALAFKKDERKKNNILSRTAFRKFFSPKILPFFKDKTPLEWVGGFIESLPKKDGCFQLPLIKRKPFPKCPGLGPISTLVQPLRFKVDLFWKENDSSQAKKDHYSPTTPRRSLPRFIKKKRSSGKKLKKEFLSERKNQKRTLDPRAVLPSTPPKPATTRGPSSSHPEQPALLKISTFEPSPATRINFQQWSQETANHLGPLFKEFIDSDLSSMAGGSSSNESKIEDPSSQWGLEPEAPSKKQFSQKQDSPQPVVKIERQSLEVTEDKTIDLSEVEDAQGTLNPSYNAENNQEKALRVLMEKMNRKKLNEKKIDLIEMKIIENENQNNQFREEIQELKNDISDIDQEILEAVRDQHTENTKANPSQGPQ